MVFLGRLLPAVGKGALVLPFAVLFNSVWFLAVWSYFRAYLADPGTVPGRWQDFVRQMGDALPVAPARPEWQPGKATYCRKCQMPRPERAKHCKVCEICVLRMDHHCPWINNCVGFYNHKFFLLLGIYSCSACLAGLGTSLSELALCIGAVMRMEDGRAFAWEEKDLETIDALVFLVFGVMALFVAVLLTPLLSTHLPLAMQNITSIEDNYENMPNPFDQGDASANLAQIFGAFGLDWFFPVYPCKPLTDGVSFERCDDPLGQSDRSSGEEMEWNLDSLSPEQLWRRRFNVRLPNEAKVATPAEDRGPLSLLTRWWGWP
eukprot:CAMPEP_0179206628 /NCGR_PEP_ID=MMETSP0796-20121207/103031_1 /TAXON_ID=73915 /ORGANISM="Pyrodinium bahamense, Strain pbaha01" /LENGTH=318 /DNA_ID=CAMNT_0020911551 /DNA_START=41 /DNA_END=997 /DNA_ORIENTATION=+